MPQKNSFTTIKLFFFALIVVPLSSLWVMDTGIAGHGVNFTRVSLFMHAVFVIFVLSFLNILLKRFLPSLVLAKGEMLILYAMYGWNTFYEDFIKRYITGTAEIYVQYTETHLR